MSTRSEHLRRLASRCALKAAAAKDSAARVVLLDGMAKADMAVCVNRTDMGEDTVGDHEIDEREFQTAHGDRLVPLASTSECSGSPLGRIARSSAWWSRAGDRRTSVARQCS